MQKCSVYPSVVLQKPRKWKKVCIFHERVKNTSSQISDFTDFMTVFCFMRNRHNNRLFMSANIFHFCPVG